MGSLNTFIGEAADFVTLSGGSGGGGISFPPVVLSGTLETFTLRGDVASSFTWTPQDNLIQFVLEMVGGGGAGGGGTGKSSQTSSGTGKDLTFNSQATAGAGGAGSGAAYTKRTYDMQSLQGNVDFTVNVAGTVTGGAPSHGGFDNAQTRNGGTGTAGGSTNIVATVDSMDTQFITAGGGFGGGGSQSVLTSIGATCGSALNSSPGAGQATTGGVSTATLTGLTLVGSAVDENGGAGTAGGSGCSALINQALLTTAVSNVTGGTGGQAGGTEAQLSGIAGGTTAASGTGSGAGAMGAEFGGGGAGANSHVQGTNTAADGDATSIVTNQSGGSGGYGVCKLTFIWSGNADDQPKDSGGNPITPD